MKEKEKDADNSEKVINLCQVFHQGISDLRGLFDFMEHKNTDKTGYCDNELLTFCNLGRTLVGGIEEKITQITEEMEIDA